MHFFQYSRSLAKSTPWNQMPHTSQNLTPSTEWWSLGVNLPRTACRFNNKVSRWKSCETRG